MTSVASVLAALRAAFTAHADATRAAGASAYMRDQFPFFGIDALTRRTLQREVERTLGLPSDVLTLAERLWRLNEREYQYAACDILRRPKALRSLTPDDVPRMDRLIVTKSWWDTVDALAPKIVGAILRPFPVLVEQTARRWIDDDNIWLQRSAILLQLDYKTDTNERLLFELIDRRASSTEFFVRKGAGWALRQYAHVQADHVARYVDERRDRLSGLTIREALKHVGTTC